MNMSLWHYSEPDQWDWNCPFSSPCQSIWGIIIREEGAKMTTITGLGLVLLILMVLVAESRACTAFLSLLLNFGFLYFAIILVVFHVPPLFVTVTIGITILAITIFMGVGCMRTTVTALYASL